jgi:hypothetical protein
MGAGKWRPSYNEVLRGASTEALSEETLGVGDWVWLVSEDGVPQNKIPYQICAIARGPDGHRYAQCAETPTGWPLVQYARAEPSGTGQPPRVPSVEAPHAGIRKASRDV